MFVLIMMKRGWGALNVAAYIVSHEYTKGHLIRVWLNMKYAYHMRIIPYIFLDLINFPYIPPNLLNLKK